MSLETGGIVETALKMDAHETQAFEFNIQVPARQRITSNFAAFTGKSSYNISHKFKTGFLSNFENDFQFTLTTETQRISIRFKICGIDTTRTSFSVRTIEVLTICNGKFGNQTSIFDELVNQPGLKFRQNWYKQGSNGIFDMSWTAEWNPDDIKWNKSVDTLRIILNVQLQKIGTISYIKGSEYLGWKDLDKSGVSTEIFTKKYFLSKSMSDVRIIDRNGDQIPAHRVILSGRSSVFELMFQQDMKENIEGLIVIDDMDVDVLKEMLYFIYAGELTDNNVIEAKAIDLYKSAHKYELEILKEQCVKQIGTTISFQNALEVYAFGDLYQEQGLMDKASEIMKKDKLKLIQDNSDLLRQIVDKYPSLGMELFKA